MTTAKKSAKPVKTVQPMADPDIARKIWLAGVGAYGRMYAETQDAVEKLANGANEAFDQLVAKGEEVEDAVRNSFTKSQQGEKIVAMVETAASKVQAFRAEQRAALETRIGKVRETVAETLAPLNVMALGQAIEKLSAHVEALTGEVASLKAEKASAAAPAPAPIEEAPAKPPRAKAKETTEA
jgi:poly(hydroxyalkanoate) granule-associated protein